MWYKDRIEKLTLAVLARKASLLWNPKIHYHVRNISPLGRIVSQLNPVHTHPPRFNNINFNMTAIFV
jgi:hypothetical protein